MKVPLIHSFLTIYVWVLILGHPAVHAGDLTPDQETWKTRIFQKAHPRILHDFGLLNMSLFAAQDGFDISPRTAALAAAMYETGGNQALYGPLAPALLEQRATQLKRKPLSDKERDRIHRIHTQIVGQYKSAGPGAPTGGIRLDITFGIGEIRGLHRIIQTCKDIEAALATIHALNGFTCTLHRSAGDDISIFVEAIHRGMPILVESEDRWQVCFGYLDIDAKCHLLLADPRNTPIEKIRFQDTPMDRESIHPFIIAARRSNQNLPKINSDYQVSVDKQIFGTGFSIEPFVPGKYKTYVLMNWRRSAAAHDQEIREILGLQPEVVHAPDPLPATPTATDLWNHYFLAQEEVIGGDAILVPGVIIPQVAHFHPLHAVLASAICSVQPSAGSFGLSLRKLYRQACIVTGDEYLLLRGEKRQRLEELRSKLEEAYELNQLGSYGVSERMKDPHMIAALFIRNTLKDAREVADALARLARFHGWQAVVESRRSLPLAKYKEALHRGIPIVLQRTAQDVWRLCIGYLRHHGQDLLLLADPAEIVNDAALHIDRTRIFPENGVFFEPFDVERYHAYFIHNWHISAEAHNDAIREIFQDETQPENTRK